MNVLRKSEQFHCGYFMFNLAIFKQKYDHTMNVSCHGLIREWTAWVSLLQSQHPEPSLGSFCKWHIHL